MHRRLGSATLSQPVFPEEGNPIFPWEKSHWDNTVVTSCIKKKKKKVREEAHPRKKTTWWSGSLFLCCPNLQFSLPFVLRHGPFLSAFRPHGLTFTWWGCCSSCLWHKPTEPAHAFFYSVLVSVSVFMALSTVFHSINFPDNSSISHSVLQVLFLPYWSFQVYISLWKSPPALM